jgi:hypothetical protein
MAPPHEQTCDHTTMSGTAYGTTAHTRRPESSSSRKNRTMRPVLLVSLVTLARGQNAGPVAINTIGGDACTSSSLCGYCEGDCDSDADCEAGFACYQRSGSETLYGCNGSPTSAWDYCLPVLTDVGVDSCTSSAPCAECAGDCDSDADCAAGLVCYQRDGTGVIPGCTGTNSAHGTNAWDYCILPVFDNSNGCTSGSPCGLCRGDCDSNDQCASGLCFQRNANEYTPGCLRGSPSAGMDYCIDASSGASGDPHIAFAHGGKADFRGSHRAYYAFISSPGYQFAPYFQEVDFWFNTVTGQGSHSACTHSY